MVRLRNAVMAAALGAGVAGCSFSHHGIAHYSIWHCDECDDFPTPGYGPGFSMMPGTYTGPPARESLEANQRPGSPPAAGAVAPAAPLARPGAPTTTVAPPPTTLTPPTITPPNPPAAPPPDQGADARLPAGGMFGMPGAQPALPPLPADPPGPVVQPGR
jgi:hypothetical protein